MPRGNFFKVWGDYEPSPFRPLYYDEDYALWAYGVRFNEYDKGILAAYGISWR